MRRRKFQQVEGEDDLEKEMCIDIDGQRKLK